jgi:hypothetical protein
VDLRPNCLTSKWEDIETLVGRERILVESPWESQPQNSKFRELLASAKSKDDRSGASVRWAVQATPRGELRLVLQGLPSPSRTLRLDPRLSADDSRTIHLESFETETDEKPDAPGRGPVPVLFARDPTAVEDSLARHPDRLYTGSVNNDNPL